MDMAKYLCQVICTVIFPLVFLGDKIPAILAQCADKEFGLQSKDGHVNCKSCSNLPRCPHGMGVSITCGDVVPRDTDIHCVPCVPGKTFSADFDQEPCQTCQSTLCHENEEILGLCLDEKDTSKCNGTCKTGFYPRGGRVDDCQPCSLCPNASFARVQKCKYDGLPVDKQCEVGLSVPPVFTSEKRQLPSKKNGETENDDKYSHESRGYQFYGHPAMFSSLLVIICVLGLFLVFVLWRRKCWKKTRSSVRCPEEVPLTIVRVDSGVGETDSYDGNSDLTPIAAVRKRKTSTSSGGRKVSFNRQRSNSGSDFSDERSVQSGAVVNELSEETLVFEEKSSQVPARKRTLSGSSGKRTPFFNRQNSNPVPEHKEERAFQKRSKTFSSFTSIISGQKGTTEETTPILQDHNANEILSLVVALPAETGSSSVEHRLSGLKIGQLNAETHRQLCAKLNRPVPNKDWKTLAGRMCYNSDDVKGFAQAQDPADAVLEHWGTKEGNDVARLIELGREIERHDVVQLLESVPDTTKV